MKAYELREALMPFDDDMEVLIGDGRVCYVPIRDSRYVYTDKGHLVLVADLQRLAPGSEGN